MRKIAVLIMLLLLPGVLVAQAERSAQHKHVLQSWQSFAPAGKDVVKEVVAFRDGMAKHITKSDANDIVAALENDAQAVVMVGHMVKNGELAPPARGMLKKLLKEDDLLRPEIVRVSFPDGFVDNYFGLRFVVDGAPPSEAFGSLFFGTGLERLGNEYDYKRYHDVLELGNDALTLHYIQNLTDVFRFNGYTRGLGKLRPLVEAKLPAGELKDRLAELYDRYYPLREGALAPSFTLPDHKGNMHSLDDFRGKVLVVDVWATWCGGCIQKLPAFMAMREKYSGCDDIEFITISIDDMNVYLTWKYSLPRHNLLAVKNLISPRNESQFNDAYQITGIPRYFIIARDGTIVTVYAPTPGAMFEQMIDRTLGN